MLLTALRKDDDEEGTMERRVSIVIIMERMWKSSKRTLLDEALKSEDLTDSG